MVNDWKETDLNFTKLFNEIKLEYLINMQIKICSSSKLLDDVICMTHIEQYTWQRFDAPGFLSIVKDIEQILRTLDISYEGIKEMVKDIHEISKKVKFKILKLQK